MKWIEFGNGAPAKAPAQAPMQVEPTDCGDWLEASSGDNVTEMTKLRPRSGWPALEGIAGEEDEAGIELQHLASVQGAAARRRR